jgi:hypothetical protein
LFTPSNMKLLPFMYSLLQDIMMINDENHTLFVEPGQGFRFFDEDKHYFLSGM